MHSTQNDIHELIYLLPFFMQPPPPVNDTNPYNVFRPREKAHRLHTRRVWKIDLCLHSPILNYWRMFVFEVFHSALYILIIILLIPDILNRCNGGKTMCNLLKSFARSILLSTIWMLYYFHVLIAGSSCCLFPLFAVVSMLLFFLISAFSHVL